VRSSEEERFADNEEDGISKLPAPTISRNSMATKTFPSKCPLSVDDRHEWDNVIDYSKAPVQVMPMIWGTYRKIICVNCRKERELRKENGDNVWEE
jgi:hypothetical protein